MLIQQRAWFALGVALAAFAGRPAAAEEGSHVLYPSNATLRSMDGPPLAIEAWTPPGTVMVWKRVPEHSAPERLVNVVEALDLPVQTVASLHDFIVVVDADEQQRHPVLTQPVRFIGAQGRTTLILPGTPVQKVGGEWVAGSAGDPSIEAAIRQASGITEPLVIPAPSVGETFTPTSAHAILPETDQAVCLIDHGMLQPGETCYAGSETTGEEQRSPVYLLSQVRGAVIGLVRVGPGLYQEREFNPRSEHAVPVPFAIGGPLGGPLPRCKEACRLADRGTAVFWEDGSPAGVTRSDVQVPESQLTRTDDRRWCLEAHVPTDVSSALAAGPPAVLCFAPRGLKPSR